MNREKKIAELNSQIEWLEEDIQNETDEDIRTWLQENLGYLISERNSL